MVFLTDYECTNNIKYLHMSEVTFLHQTMHICLLRKLTHFQKNEKKSPQEKNKVSSLMAKFRPFCLIFAQKQCFLPAWFCAGSQGSAFLQFNILQDV